MADLRKIQKLCSERYLWIWVIVDYLTTRVRDGCDIARSIIAVGNGVPVFVSNTGDSVHAVFAESDSAALMVTVCNP
jgi:hypothetical protein